MALSDITPVSIPARGDAGWRATWVWPARRRVALWLALMAVGVALLATWRYAQLGERFDEEARSLHRTIAQRIGQHDAHLTNLAAVAQLDDPEHASFLAVAAAVQNFYPRIASIDLVRIAPSTEVLVSTRNRTTPTPFTLADVQQRAGSLAAGRAAMLDAPAGPGYALVKRMGTAPPSALVLVIDAARLIEPDGAVEAGTRVWLTDARGTVFGQALPTEERRLISWPRTLRFEQPLPSTSQPLQLVMTRHPSRAELLPVGWLLLLAVGSALLLWLQGSVQRVRRARREAALQAQELRLAHAMRVNGLGEMASGIAHELTQPLTAMLSQSQAGLRLIEQGADASAMVPILQANVRLARRSGEILDRIRSYVSQREPVVSAVELNPLAGGVADLARADLQARGIALELALDAAAPMVRIDAIAIEQVLHNLVRNAAEALQGEAGRAPEGARIVIATRHGGAHAGRGAMVQVAVRDNGPGIGSEQLGRLFEPFFTTKPGGMGLGLSLCERLVETLGGRIEVRSVPGGGSEFIVHLRSAPAAAGA
jgi:signal transduction histidine kinase